MEQGLLPSEPWGRWHGLFGYQDKGILESEFKGTHIYLVFFDRQRPTTGYHLAITRRTSGTGALLELGERTDWNSPEEVPESYPVLLDILATAPRDNWNIEHRAVSPYQVFAIGYGSFDSNGVLDLAIRVNGELVFRRDISRDELTDAVVELPLPEIREAALPSSHSFLLLLTLVVSFLVSAFYGVWKCPRCYE
jgi:hypothetical protein